MKSISVYTLLALLFIQCSNSNSQNATAAIKPTKKMEQLHSYYSRTDTTKLNLTNEDWKKILPEDVYEIMRLKHTERAFTGKYWDTYTKGDYYCASCGNHLFKSDSKFNSSCGWPSFFEQLNPNSVTFERDTSYGMIREEALCGRCGGHLGHRFDDGPEPTRMRYCMNSIALDFEPDINK